MYVCKRREIVFLYVLVCFETVVVLNDLNTVIYLILKGNPRKAVCVWACVLSCCAEVHFFAGDKCFDVCLCLTKIQPGSL